MTEYPHLHKRYFCASTGTITDEMIRAYLDAHGKPAQDFQVEEPQ